VTPFETTSVYAQANTSSVIAGLLHRDEFAAVLGTTPDDAWVKVDLAPGSTGAALVGWMDQSNLLFQGSCGSVPTLSP
jgi:hypothetical protein